ncbi:hypothetical protein BGZ59_007417 [Podila verticillata]|nr:hypothetical protein BGZ59_007417 [Podila verticillata]
MESFEFPDVRLVSVESVMMQVATFIRGQDDPNKARPLPLSDKASDLVQVKSKVSPQDKKSNCRFDHLINLCLNTCLPQKVLWATVMTEHKVPSTIRLTNPEFSLVLSVVPWKLPRLYEILVDGEPVKTAPFKIRADLQDPENDDDAEQES